MNDAASFWTYVEMSNLLLLKYLSKVKWFDRKIVCIYELCSIWKNDSMAARHILVWWFFSQSLTSIHIQNRRMKNYRWNYSVCRCCSSDLDWPASSRQLIKDLSGIAATHFILTDILHYHEYISLYFFLFKDSRMILQTFRLFASLIAQARWEISLL